MNMENIQSKYRPQPIGKEEIIKFWVKTFYKALNLKVNVAISF